MRTSLLFAACLSIVACASAPDERAFTPNAIVEASEGSWHVYATTFNEITGEKQRLEWDLALRAISPDALAFEIHENGRRTQWGEQTFTIDPDQKTVRVAQWSQSAGVEKRVTLAGGGQLAGYGVLMELVGEDGAHQKSAHYFVHRDRCLVVDAIDGQWRTEEVRERQR